MHFLQFDVEAVSCQHDSDPSVRDQFHATANQGLEIALNRPRFSRSTVPIGRRIKDYQIVLFAPFSFAIHILASIIDDPAYR
jgi:hypothetical protein